MDTVTGKSPTVVRSDAGMVAVSWVALTKVVVRFDPAKRTTEEDTKFVPVTVIVKPVASFARVVGEMLVVVGTGLDAGGGAATARVPEAVRPGCCDVETVKLVDPAGVLPVVETVSVDGLAA